MQGKTPRSFRAPSAPLLRTGPFRQTRELNAAPHRSHAQHLCKSQVHRAPRPHPRTASFPSVSGQTPSPPPGPRHFPRSLTLASFNYNPLHSHLSSLQAQPGARCSPIPHSGGVHFWWWPKAPGISPHGRRTLPWGLSDWADRAKPGNRNLFLRLPRSSATEVGLEGRPYRAGRLANVPRVKAPSSLSERDPGRPRAQDAAR